MYSVFIFCLFPPEECVFHNRNFLREPCLTEGGNVDLVSTKFPRNEGGPPSGLEEASLSRRVRTFHAPKIISFFLFFFFFFKFLPLLRVKPPAAAG